MGSSPRFKNQLAKLRPRSAPLRALWLGMFRGRKNAKHYHVTELPCKKCVPESAMHVTHAKSTASNSSDVALLRNYHPVIAMSGVPRTAGKQSLNS